MYRGTKGFMSEPIHFTAQVNRVQTLADGGLRLTLDLSETDIDTASWMMHIKQAGLLLELAALPFENKKNIQETNAESELDKGNKRKSAWTT